MTSALITKRRQSILILSLGVGGLTLLGSILFAVGGAGIYGSPFSGDNFFNLTLLLVLLCGPVAVLPLTIVDFGKRGWGGIILCSLSLIEVILITLNNVRQWGFAVHDAALGSLSLALPMFVIGTVLYFSGKQKRSVLDRIWWIELLLVIATGVYFLWHVGGDGVSALFNILQGGTI